MSRTALSTLALTLVMATPAMPPAQAGTGIQRCLLPDGTQLYTDQSCAASGATPAPISGELATRLIAENRRELENQDSADAPVSLEEVELAMQAPAQPARRSAAGGCARTPEQLQADLQGAFALGDVNRIAESYHWAGMRNQQGQQVMDRLDRMRARPLLAASYFPGNGIAQMADGSWANSGEDSGGTLQLTFGNGGAATVTDFEVTRYEGCYFVRLHDARFGSATA